MTNISIVMDFEAEFDYCGMPCSGSTPGDTSEIRPSSIRQAGERHSPTACLSALLRKGKKADIEKSNCHVLFSEGRESNTAVRKEDALSRDEEPSNGPNIAGRSSPGSHPSVKKAERVVRLDAMNESDISSPPSKTSETSAALAHAVDMMQPKRLALSTSPALHANGSSSGRGTGTTVDLGEFEGGTADGSPANACSTRLAAILSVSIPTNMPTYLEPCRLCASSPDSTPSTSAEGRLAVMTGLSKVLIGTDEGKSLLSRFETLSTQPSQPHLGTECAGAGVSCNKPGVTRSNVETDDAGYTSAEESYRATTILSHGSGRTTVVNAGCDGSARCSLNSRITKCVKGVLMSNDGECKTHRSLYAVNQSIRDPATSKDDVYAALHSPLGSVRRRMNDVDALACCTLRRQVTSGIAQEKGGSQGNVENTNLGCQESAPGMGRSTSGTSPNWGNPPHSPLRNRFPSPRAEASNLSFEALTEPSGRANCRTVACETSGTPVNFGASFKTIAEGMEGEDCTEKAMDAAKTTAHETKGDEHRRKASAPQTSYADETKGDEHTGKASTLQAPYVPVGDPAASHGDTTKKQVAAGYDDTGNRAVDQMSRASGAPANLTDNSSVREHKKSRNTGAGGEGSAPAGTRGRPSLGAAGRQLLLDHIRAKYHTNVGLYSGIIRKNYNSTISKLPFFTVSLLHQLAADFGIDTTAVLDQQHQQYYDPTRKLNNRHNGDAGCSTGGRRGKHNTLDNAALARGRRAINNSGFHPRRNPPGDRRLLAGDSPGTNAHSMSPEKQRGRSHYDGLSRRRCNRRMGKSNESAGNSTTQLSAGGGRTAAAGRDTGRRSTEPQGTCTSWGSEMINRSSTRTQQHQVGISCMKGVFKTCGDDVSEEQKAEVRQVLDTQGPEQRYTEGYASGLALSLDPKEIAGEREAWTGEAALHAALSYITTVNGIARRGRTPAVERLRQETKQQPSQAADQPQCDPGSSNTTAVYLLSPKADRDSIEGDGKQRWQNFLKASLPRQAHGREQQHVLNTPDSDSENRLLQEQEGVGDVCVSNACTFDECASTGQNAHNKWNNGLTASQWISPINSAREENPSSKICADTTVWSRHYAGSWDAAFTPWPRDAHAEKVPVGPAAESRRASCPLAAAFPTEASSVTSGLPAEDGSARLPPAHLGSAASTCGHPDAQLWSLVVSQLPGETVRALRSALAGYRPNRVAVLRENSEEVGLEYGAECSPNSAAAALWSRQAAVVSRNQKEIHCSAHLPHSTPKPSETSIATATAVPAVKTSSHENREWISRTTATGSSESSQRKAAEVASSVTPAKTKGGSAASVMHVEPLLKASLRAPVPGHLRKKLKTEVLRFQHKDELPPQPVPSIYGEQKCCSPAHTQDFPALHSNRRSTTMEARTPELLSQREQISGSGQKGTVLATFRGAAVDCILPRFFASKLERDNVAGRALDAETDTKRSNVARSASRDSLPPNNVGTSERRRADTDERKSNRGKAIAFRQKSASAIETCSNCSDGRELRSPTDDGIAGAKFLPFPFCLTQNEDPKSQKPRSGVNSPPLLLRQQQSKCPPGLVPAVASRTPSTPRICGPGEHSGVSKSISTDMNSPYGRSLARSWSSTGDCVKLASGSPSPTKSSTASLMEQLTASCTPTPPLYGTNGTLVDVNITPPASVRELKSQQHQLQQRGGPPTLYTGGKLASCADIREPMRMDVETGVCTVPFRTWTSREAVGGNSECTLEKAHQNAPHTPRGDNIAARDARSAACASVAPNAGFADTVPPVSSIPPLHSEDATETDGSNYSALRVVVLLQMISELQTKAASTQMPPQSHQQQRCHLERESSDERGHLILSSFPNSTQHLRDENVPTRRVSDQGTPAVSSSLLPSLQQNLSEKEENANETKVQQSTDTFLEQQALQPIQEQEQEIASAPGGPGSDTNNRRSMSGTARLHADLSLSDEFGRRRRDYWSSR